MAVVTPFAIPEGSERMKCLEKLIASSLMLPLSLSMFGLSGTSASAADVIEPGSPESAIEWTLDTLDYVDGVMTAIHTGNWGYQTIQYANDMKSLLTSYQAFYDNQNQWTGVLPQFETLTGFVAIKDDSPQGYSLRSITCTGVLNHSETDYRTPGGFTWLNSGAGFMRTTSNTFPAGTGGTSQCVFASDSNWVVTFGVANRETNGTFCYAQPWQMTSWSNGFAADFFIQDFPSYTYEPNVAYGHPACFTPYAPSWRNRPYKIVSDGTIDGLKELYDKIDEQYPDRENIFPDITPPEADPDYNPEEPTEPPSHPDGCHCEVHVVVTVDVNHDDIEFPTYDVTDVPEPSDFDFSVIETVDPSEAEGVDLSPDVENLPEGAIEGAGFWFNLMETVIDTFNVRALVYTLAGLAFLLYLIWR